MSSKPKSFYMLDNIEMLLSIRPNYDSDEESHKVLSEIHPIDDWVNKINEIFYFHLSSKMILNKFQSYADSLMISADVFRQILMDSPRCPTVPLDYHVVVDILKSIMPFVAEAMEQASTNLFVITVDSIITNENVVEIKYTMHRQAA